MSEKTTDKGCFDVAIIGGGPAGITAAIWCADLGLSCFFAEGHEPLGGQLNWINAPITNYPAARTANGGEMAQRFVASLNDVNIVRSNQRVISIGRDPLVLRTTGDEIVEARALIVATGIRRRTLSIAGEREFVGRGILSSGAGSKAEIRGKRVVIVGGGDAAIENACILSEEAERVIVVHRRNKFAAREKFLTEVKGRENIEFRLNSELVSINGDDRVRSVTCRSIASGSEDEIAADAVLIRVGVEPNSDLVKDLVKVDDRGYVVVDRHCVTNAPNIFAIGDVSNPNALTIAGAVGDAATAVKAVHSLLYASKRL